MLPDWLPGRLRLLREARGLSQVDLARKTGLSERFLAQCESGGKDPSMASILKLAETLDVDLSSFLKPPGVWEPPEFVRQYEAAQPEPAPAPEKPARKRKRKKGGSK